MYRLWSMLDGAIFYGTLALCVALGSYYKKIDDLEMKRVYGAGLGLLVACIISGSQIYHSILVVWGNIVIIKCCDKRYNHHISLIYTWIYLVYMHLNPNVTVYIIWLHQTIALRLVGLATEMHLSLAEKPETRSSLDLTADTMDPSATEIITYAYFFVGLHKGPYFRWKIYEDHFITPFGVLGDCRVITEQKLKKAFICFLGYLLLRIKYSPNEYFGEQFYYEYSMELRYLYSLPQLIMFFLERQLIMLLCTCVFTETGFGVYPAKCLPAPGHGPTTAYSFLKLASTAMDIALQQEFNFAMLKCFNNEKVVFGPKMRDTLQGWEIATRYWFTNYIYRGRNFNRDIRSACSYFAWWIWNGASLPQLLMLATLWIYVPLEKEYAQLYDEKDEPTRIARNLGFSLMRLFCLIYLTPCFLISDASTVLRYYNSLYWSYHIVMMFMILLIAAIHKIKGRLSFTAPPPPTDANQK